MTLPRGTVEVIGQWYVDYGKQRERAYALKAALRERFGNGGIATYDGILSVALTTGLYNGCNKFKEELNDDVGLLFFQGMLKRHEIGRSFRC